MKKIYKIIIWAIILTIIISGFFYFPIEIWIDRDILWSNYLFPIIVNIAAYIIRTIILGIVNQKMKGKVIRFVFAVILNLIWAGFVLWFVFSVAPTYALAITSFLIVAISMTFRNRINNIVAGAMIIITEVFEVGDLIETSGVQGIVEDISLNYTQIRQFDGILTILPNQKVYNSKITKFTNKTFITNKKKVSEEETGFFERYGEKLTRIISKGKKITRYIKIIEIRYIIDPEELDKLLNIVFDKYEPLMGYRPIYYVNKTTFDRCSITLQLIGEDPNAIILHANTFLKDILYKLYSEEIFENWRGKFPVGLMINKNQEGDK